MGRIFWDIDGTLLETDEVKIAVFVEAFASSGPTSSLGRRVHQSHPGATRAEKLQLIAREACGAADSREVHEERLRLVQTLMLSSIRDFQLVPGVVEALSFLAVTNENYAVSAMPQIELDEVMTSFNLSKFFVTLIGDCGDKGREVRSTLSGEPAVVVGDSSADSAAAQIADIPFVQIATRGQCKLSGADLYLNHLQDAGTLIQALLRSQVTDEVMRSGALYGRRRPWPSG